MKANITLKLDTTLCVKLAYWQPKRARRLVLCWQLASSKSCANVKLTSELESEHWLDSAEGSICSGRLLAPAMNSTNDEYLINHVG